jgi:hypothetical protein
MTKFNTLPKHIKQAESTIEKTSKLIVES